MVPSIAPVGWMAGSACGAISTGVLLLGQSIPEVGWDQAEKVSFIAFLIILSVSLIIWAKNIFVAQSKQSEMLVDVMAKKAVADTKLADVIERHNIQVAENTQIVAEVKVAVEELRRTMERK